ncbi:MAG: hypothetical protein A2934_03315 [Candidatus Sungbacteria bacterium RIFCSPLOWO2_01_FULL_47_10]|uniref:Uncharacterized protein n=1 Tax=Candidatus Sungbacteria bacterium RIFCSPLOWO2_01_FULL_47_10 TaxID=1802276 RepID=A0A1G2L5S4_9BACT|nr:MAG: hypothetical protein A2934_03315 [Candidatus Sungbacteria bacterium RIFCSPLOWO2_01_FULL_47_10]
MSSKVMMRAVRQCDRRKRGLAEESLAAYKEGGGGGGLLSGQERQKSLHARSPWSSDTVPPRLDDA